MYVGNIIVDFSTTYSTEGDTPIRKISYYWTSGVERQQLDQTIEQGHEHDGKDGRLKHRVDSAEEVGEREGSVSEQSECYATRHSHTADAGKEEVDHNDPR